MDDYLYIDRDGDRIRVLSESDNVIIELKSHNPVLDEVLVLMRSKEIKKLRKFLKEALAFINGET